MALALREYGLLASSGERDSLDFQRIDAGDFAHLKQLALRQDDGKRFLRLSMSRGTEVLQVQNYVGVLSLPSGVQVEIVPKTTFGVESVSVGRRVLLKMLSAVFDLDFRTSELADLESLERPWLEALIGHVLRRIAGAVRPGLCKAYRRRSDEGPFLKGQLQIVLQLRQRIGKEHHFHTRHDHYSANRPENRLLKAALEQLARWTKDPRNQQLCRELRFVMNDVPVSSNARADLEAWSFARDTVRYEPLLPWIRLILSYRSPAFAEGGHEGVALLFPMETLFERYVARTLKRYVLAPFVVKEQARSEYLVVHQGKPWFQLRPDLVILDRKAPIAVLDTKWKLLDSRLADTEKKYGLSQSDFYQLLAYGERYLRGVGDMFLIYPRHSAFAQPLPSFDFSETLRVWAIPFDTKEDRLIWPTSIALPWHRDERLQRAG